MISSSLTEVLFSWSRTAFLWWSVTTRSLGADTEIHQSGQMSVHRDQVHSKLVKQVDRKDTWHILPSHSVTVASWFRFMEQTERKFIFSAWLGRSLKLGFDYKTKPHLLLLRGMWYFWWLYLVDLYASRREPQSQCRTPLSLSTRAALARNRRKLVFPSIWKEQRNKIQRHGTIHNAIFCVQIWHPEVEIYLGQLGQSRHSFVVISTDKTM